MSCMDRWASQHWGPSNSGSDVHYVHASALIQNPRGNSGLFKVDSACNLPSHHETDPPFPLCLSATKILRERPDKIPVTTIHRWHKQCEESELFPTKGFKHKKSQDTDWGLFEKTWKKWDIHMHLCLIKWLIIWYSMHVMSCRMSQNLCMRI